MLSPPSITTRVRLMCALRAHINKSIFGKVLLGIEKVVKTFSIPKLVYYCVPLGHTLVKSLQQ